MIVISTFATPLHSSQAGDLATDRRLDPAHTAQAASALQAAPKYKAEAFAPHPLAPRTAEGAHLDRLIAKSGASGAAATYTFPKKYLSTAHNAPVGQPTDQKSSGRCWIFANLNVLRTHALAQHKDLQYAQNYVAYWDKVERANAFLEKMIELAPLGASSQRVLNLVENFYTDGGDWEFFRNIVLKYGVVPDYAMPETSFSGNSNGYMNMLTRRLHEVGGVLHQKAQAGAAQTELQSIKASALDEVRGLLNKYLGTPPQSFVWKKPDGKLTHVTPQAFYAQSGVDVRDMVHLSNLPYLPENTRIKVADVNNVVGAPGMECLNVGVGEIKAAVRRSIKDGVPVMFAAETCESDFEKNLFAVGSNATEAVAGLKDIPRLDKGLRLQYRVTKLAHAMTLSGCDDADMRRFDGPEAGADSEFNGPLWRIENSWKDRETLYMTDAWFDTYVYAVVVHPKYLSDATQTMAKDPFLPTRVVDAWDPLGRI